MQCATVGCGAETVGKSKYCKPHRAEARKAWVAKVKASADERDARNKAWGELHAEAHAAGLVAAEAHTPVPMGVTDGKQTWVVDGGMCGFAWVTIHPANCSFAIWLKKQEGDRVYRGHRGGLQRFAPLGTQSMSIKEAYCGAYAKVLQAKGIKAYAGSRLD